MSKLHKEKTKKTVNLKNVQNAPLAEDQQNNEDSNQFYLDVDPDLQADVEIDLPKSHRAVSRTTMSAKSRKTIQSGRQSENRENIVRSRGRPIKPHETEPFLSINTLPPEKSFVSEKSAVNSNAAHSRTSKPAPQVTDESRSLEAQLQRMSAYMSPYNHYYRLQTTGITDFSAHSRTSKPAPQVTDESRSLEAQLQRMSAYMSPYNQQTPVPPSPSVVTGHIYTKNAQSAKGQRTSPCKTSGSRPSSKAKHPLAPSKPSDINTNEENKVFDKISPNLANLNEEKVQSDSPELDVPENKKTKLSRPSTAPASSQGMSLASKIQRPQSDKADSVSVKQMSRPNTGSVRSRISSAGSRSGAGSRAGFNMFGFRTRSRSRSRSERRKTSAGRRSVPSRTGRVTPANTPYHSPNKSFRAPNHHVKSPFKHAVNQPELSLDGRQTPSMGMKERTALAAFHVHKMLSVAGEKDVHKVSGKLQKGKLKPLYPVNVQGPTIDKCRGIISETRSYQPSPSRTLQRRVNLMNKIPNVHEYLYERPRTVESVHQTSVASSVDENFNADHPDTNRSLPDEILYTQDQLEPKTPENTFLPEPTQDEIVDGVQTMGMDETPRMFATEVGLRDQDAIADVTVHSRIHQELHLSESATTVQETSEVITENKNNNYTGDTDKGETEQVHSEERARIGSPSKSVRFAEQKEKLAASQNSKELKQMVNENIAKQDRDINSGESKILADVNYDDDIDADVIETVSRKNKRNTKGSCKPEDSDTILRKDDDDDDDDKDDQGRDVDNKDDNRKFSNNKDSSGTNSGANDGDNKENMSKNNKSSGQKRTASASQPRSRSSSRTRQGSRSKDDDVKNLGSRSQVRKSCTRLSSNKGSSNSSHCSRFEQSKASNTHTHTLEVSSVIHGDTVATVLGPESPKRGRSRSASPRRNAEQTFQFFSQRSRPCFEEVDDFCSIPDNSNKSKVKFMLEGEEPEMETIFIENDEEINVRKDTEITYDVLDSEIEMLRSAIQNALINKDEGQAEENVIASDKFFEEDIENIESSDSETVIMETETVDTIRGDYSNLLEKYRQRCMNRSEGYGSISATLVTPRDTQSMTSSRSRSLGSEMKKNSFNNRDNSQEHSKGNKTFEGTQHSNSSVLSDSGHGSVDNLSDLSRSTNQTQPDVPRLDLGGSTSDLGLGSVRSDVTVSAKNVEENVGEDKGGKNLLEMVCDQLSPVEQRQKPVKRREMEEDVANLKIVATIKSLSKNSKKKGPCSGVKQAPFPPVCFTVNARPPKGYLYYFAYGPDMNPNRFSSYIQRNTQDRYWGLLFGFNLVFNKKGTSEEAGGFANLEFNPLRSVEGCIYKITPHELQILDKCVGYPQHYEHLVLPVWLSNSPDADGLGVAQYCVPALTYIAQNRWTETEKPLNFDYALSQCIKSADMVTTSYKDSLVAMATRQEVTASA